MLYVDIKKFKYDENEYLLKNISLKLNKGQIYCITGNNGSGKTTLLNIISGLIPEIINAHFEGTIKFNNNKLSFKDIDYVFQNSESSLFFNKVDEQLSCLNNKDLPFWLEKFNLTEKYNSQIKELSIGEKKIISSISALLSNRPICIMDEPSANLDNNNKKTLLNLIEKTKQNKIVILVSHDNDVINLSDYIYKVDKKGLKEVNKKNQQKNIKELDENFEHKEILLTLENFIYKFENNTTYNSCKIINIEKGAIVGVIGKNGSGKTTLANYILKHHKKFRKMGITTQEITCAIMFQNFYKQLFKFSVENELKFGCDNAELLYSTEEILKKINLYNKKLLDPRLLSDGQKRILLVASLLMKKVDLLILDEPFDNIDKETQKIIKELLINFKKTGSTIIILDQTLEYFDDIVDQCINLDIKNDSEKTYDKELTDKGFKYIANGLIHNIYEKNNYIYKIVKSNLPLFNVDNHFEKELRSHQFLIDNKIKNVVEIKKIYKKNELIKNYSVLVEKKIAGKCYKDTEITQKNIEKIISFLINTSKISVEKYGVIFDSTVSSKQSWEEYMLCQIKTALKILQKHFPKDKLMKKFIKNKNNFKYKGESKFLIMDPNTENFIFNSESFIAIDIDHPIGGDPLWQIACIYWYKPDWLNIKMFRELILKDELQILKYAVLFGLNVIDFLEKNNLEIKKELYIKIYKLYSEVKNFGN